MVWKETLEQYETQKKWLEAIQLLELTIKKEPDWVEAYVRIMYLLHRVLMEQNHNNLSLGQYGELTYNSCSFLLKHYFKMSYAKFFDHAEYLFFMGQRIQHAEKHFGENQDSNLALNMQEKAFEKEPSNILYQWAYLLNFLPFKKVKEAHRLTRYLYGDATKEVIWLKSKGYPGKCVLDTLKWSYYRYLDELALQKYVLEQYLELLRDFLDQAISLELFKQYYAEMITKENCIFQEKTSFIFQELSKNIGAQANEPALRQKVSEALEGLKNIQASF